jgi:hypothetical protein
LEGRQTITESSADKIAAALLYNEARLNAAPLASLGFTAIGATTQVPLPAPYDAEPQNRQPFAGSPLIDINGLSSEEFSVRFNVYADGVLRFSELVGESVLVRNEDQPYVESVRQGVQIKLPAGFKHERWSFEVLGKRHIYHIHVAETAKGLADV